MKTRFPFVANAALGLLFALGSCSHEHTLPGTAGSQPAPNQTAELLSPKEEADETEAERLVSDIIYAKAIESGQLARPAQEPISIGLVGGRGYRYPSLRAYRADIRHRMDSLRRAGITVDYDTLITNPIISGKLRLTHD